MRTILLLSGLLCVSALACARPAPPNQRPGAGKEASKKDRVPAVKASDPLYDRVEGTSFKNACRSDAECHVGGCSSEVCSAEEGVITTCEFREFPQRKVAAACGCVAGKCVWYTGKGQGKGQGQGQGQASGQGPGIGMPCPDGRCAEGLRCLTYYGVAGPAGPKFTSCEIPCTGDKGCPKGTSCVAISDGPGHVCRSTDQEPKQAPQEALQ